MTTIYAVTIRSMTNFQILGLFSARHKAEAFLASIGLRAGEENTGIEGWIIDEMEGAELAMMYSISVELQTGLIEPQGEFKRFIRPGTGCLASEGADGHSVVIDSPVSFEHAVKFAIDHRRKWLKSWLKTRDRHHSSCRLPHHDAHKAPTASRGGGSPAS